MPSQFSRMEKNKQHPKYPRGNLFIKYNLPARIFFCWIDPLFWYGARHTLQHEDLYAHPPEADSQYLLNQFNKYWKTELIHYHRGEKPRMWRAIAKILWWRILIHGILCSFLASLLVLQSVILGHITEYFAIQSPTPDDTQNAYLLATGMSVLIFVTVSNNATSAYLGFKLGMLVRIICSSAIYQKLIKLSQGTVSRLTSGQIVNLASNDVHRFDQSMMFYHYFWIGPIHLAVVTYLVYQEIGPTSFLAMFMVIVQIPLQVYLAKTFIKYRLGAANKTDQRVKVMNEVIVGIRVIKMYGWEHAFRKLVSSLRKKEVQIILKGSVIRAINLSYYVIALPAITFVVFSVFAYIEGFCSLTPKRVFTTLSLLTYVRLTSVNFLLKGIIQVAEGKVALKRISDFLLQDELDQTGMVGILQDTAHNDPVTPISMEMCNNSVLHSDEKPELSVNNMCASWNDDPDRLSLRNVTFTVNEEAPLLAVIGSVGAGKSTLLQCLLDELSLTSGHFKKKGKLGYAAQEPWIFSATLKDNILFGEPYQSDWYSEVIKACSLSRDIEELPYGDLTLVGERGVTLSGGQKARVSLARAVYSRADIYLLDDPLSAVDAAVSREIFDRCVKWLIHQQSSLVVLVTHQLQYVHQCDRVLGLKEGEVVFYGQPTDIASSGIDLFSFVSNEDESKKKKKEEEDQQFAIRKQSTVPPPSNMSNDTVDESEEQLGNGDTFQLSEDEEKQTLLTDDENEEKKRETMAVQLPAEERAQGKIGLKTYYRYFHAGGGLIFTVFVFMAFLVGEGTVVSSDTLLSLWTKCSCEGGSNGNCSSCNTTDSAVCRLQINGMVSIYGGLVGSVWLTCIGRTVLFYVLSLRAATVLHDKMFKSVIRAPVLFFDSNPVGRILNRFSKDIGFLDDLLIFSFCEFLQLLTRFLAIMSAAIVSNVYLLIVIGILLVAFVFFRWYYLRTAREIKRIEAVARSPLYSHISMTIQGLSTIRSYQKQGKTVDQFHAYHNSHTQAWDAYIVTSRWFGMRIDGLSCLFIITLFFMSIWLLDILDLDPALVGLALTYSLSLNGMFQYCIRQSAEVENYMVSAERVIAYGDLTSEAPLETFPKTEKPSPEWPEKGEIEVTDLIYRHSKDSPVVLKGLNFTVEAGEKIGIVGRTGAGKSSLIACFFRIAEPGGSIVIDGIEILKLGLHDVRTKIAIIPQDPVLFSGSIRYNLDPFSNYDDSKIWRALEQVQLDGLIQSLDGGLDALVTEGGSNFSVGQRQLFCLSRALLRNNKILMLDEATANVDLETDAIIQQVIRKQFTHCTVLTIAHRLDTVMDSDRIMVMKAGELVEFNEPHVLLSNSNSYLLKLVDHTGPAASEKLKAMALKAYRAKRNELL